MEAAALRVCYVATLVFLIGLCPPPAPAATDSFEEGPFMLRLERGDSLQVIRLEPATFGMFRYVRTDSIEGYFAGYRLRSITDVSGLDVTQRVLEKRRAIGARPPETRSPKPPKVHPPSRREVRHFPVFEVGVYGRVDGTSFPYQGTKMMVSLDFGELRNLSRSTSVGATVHLEGDDDRVGFGFALRGRRWLKEDLSVDGSSGWLLAGSDDRGDFHAPAFYGEVAVNLGDHLQLAARVESWRVAQRLYLYDYRGYATPGSLAPLSQPASGVIDLGLERETLVHLGGKVGIVPGIPILLLFLLVTAGTSSVDY